jgi:hypothetical protein
MRRWGVATAVALTLTAGAAWAQDVDEAREEDEREAVRRDDAQREDVRREPVRRIRVLEHPYDIASFYRSHQGDAFGYGYEPAPAPGDRYAIAGYYRSRQGGRTSYPAFWYGGYGQSRRRQPLVVGFRRSIGEHGDLFLFAPTFLAPLGPLTGAFFER